MKIVVYIKNRFPNIYKMLKNSSLVRKVFYIPGNHIMKKRKKAVQDYGYQALEKIYNLSKRLNMVIWLDGGTLLGYVREGCLLEYDYDIDLATDMLETKDRKRLVSEFEKSGLQHIRSFKENDICYTDTFDYKGVVLDIHYYEKEGNTSYFLMYNSAEKKSKTVKRRMKNGEKAEYTYGFDAYKFIATDLEFVEGEFPNKCKVFIPKDAEKRIEEMYGVNWRIPIKDEYIWTRDTNNTYMGFHQDAVGWFIK